MAVLLPEGKQSFTTATGAPGVGYKLYTYSPGTSTPKATYTTSVGNIANTNPVIADARGEMSVYWVGSYDVILKDASDVTVWGPERVDEPEAAGAAAASTGTLRADLADEASASLGASLLGYNPVRAYGDGLGQFLNLIYARTAGEIAASVTPTAYSYLPGDVRRYGGVADGATNDATAVTAAITAMGLTGTAGGEIYLPAMSAIQSTITQPNRVRFRSPNVRKGGLKAVSAFSGTYMVNAVNGTISMFDAGLQDMNLDCNSLAGLGGVLSDAWQENSGMHRVLINKFRTYGVRFQNGFGGASSCVIAESEIFGDPLGATAGIYLDQISLTGGFKLTVRDSTVAGGGALPSSLPRGIHIVNDSSAMTNVHFEVCQTGIYLDGVGNHTLICCDGAGGTSLVDTLVEIASTFTGSLTMIGCQRNGATNFLVDNRSGGLGTISGRDIAHLHIPSVSGANDGIRAPNTAKALAVFNGTGAGPYTLGSGMSRSFNVSSIAKTGTGRWRVTLSRAMDTADSIGFASSNADNATEKAAIVGTTTVDIGINISGAAADANEIKFVVF